MPLDPSAEGDLGKQGRVSGSWNAGTGRKWTLRKLNAPGLEEFITAVLILNSLGGFGPAKFRSLYRSGGWPSELVTNPSLFKDPGKTADRLRVALARVSSKTRQEKESM